MMSTPTMLAAVAAAWAILAAAPAAADPNVQHLTPVLPDTPERDDAFLDALANAGIQVVDVRAAIAGGRDACAYMVASHSAEQTVEKGLANNPTLTRVQQIAYVNAAIETWCPRQTGLNTLA